MSETPVTPAEPKLTIDLPDGHTAELHAFDELTGRRQQPLKALGIRTGDLFERLFKDGVEGYKAICATLSDKEAMAVAELEPVIGWAYLKSWTRPEPLPKTAGEFFDLPVKLFNPLVMGALTEQSRASQNGFEASEQTLDNPASPTGASAS